MEGKGGEENLESPSVLQPHSRLHPAQREEEEEEEEGGADREKQLWVSVSKCGWSYFLNQCVSNVSVT